MISPLYALITGLWKVGALNPKPSVLKVRRIPGFAKHIGVLGFRVSGLGF